tara:strand:+ start:31 stop:285 length:255 start_codon:yes stop_codon:yes gene_type:complete
MATKKTRARTGKGRYRGDDPSTPNKNEAWVDKPVKTASAKKKAPAVKTEPAKKKAPAKKRLSPSAAPPWSAAYKAMVLRGEIKE